MSSPARVTGQKIDKLESIRGLAATFIVLYHIPKWNSAFDNGIFNNSYLMVELFFVLSGFVMLTAYGERLNTGRDLLKFQFLRLGRLYPLHLIFTVAFLLIEVLKYFAQQKSGLAVSSAAAFSKNSWGAFVEQLLLVQAIGPTGNNFTFNVPAWSISVEFYTYLLFGLCTLLFRTGKLYGFGIISLSALLLLASGNSHGFELLLKCLTGFFLGCLIAALSQSGRWALPRHLWLLFALMIVALVAVKTETRHDWLIFFPTAALILSVVRAAPSARPGLLSNRCCVWLGTISYSVYMSHMLVIWVANQMVRYLLKRPESLDMHGNFTPQLSSFEAIIGLVLIFAGVLAVGSAVHYLIEKPLRAASRRLADRLFSSRNRPAEQLAISES